MEKEEIRSLIRSEILNFESERNFINHLCVVSKPEPLFTLSLFSIFLGFVFGCMFISALNAVF